MADFLKSVSFNFARKDLLHNTARMAAVESVNFFKRRFVEGGWKDLAFEKWAAAQNPFAGFRTLSATNNLRNSIRTTEQSTKRVVVASHLPYAEIHNEGGYITVTAEMKRYFWRQYYLLAGQSRKSRSAQAKLSAKAEFCRRMALAKVGSKIKMPQRQFIGESQTLMSNLEKQFYNIINEHWRKA